MSPFELYMAMIGSLAVWILARIADSIAGLMRELKERSAS